MRNQKLLARVEMRLQVVVDYELEEGDSSVGIGPCALINRIYVDRLVPTNHGLEVKWETHDIPIRFVEDEERERLEEYLLESEAYHDEG